MAHISVSIPLRYADNCNNTFKTTAKSVFQFLLGTLITSNYIKELPRKTIVSIPLRYADNIHFCHTPECGFCRFQFLLGTLITGAPRRNGLSPRKRVSIPLRYADNQRVSLLFASLSRVSIPLRYADNL